MSYVKKFKTFCESVKYGPNRMTDISEDIAEDIISKLEELKKSQGGHFTVEDYMQYMEERGSDEKTTDDVMHYLVNKGFIFSMDEEEPLTDEEIAGIKLKED